MKWMAYGLAAGLGLVSPAVCAQEHLRTSDVTLDCGGSRFDLSTSWHRGAPIHLIWDRQRLSSGGRTIDLFDTVDARGPNGLPAAVTGWQCVRGTSAYVLVLAYSCASDIPAACDGQREWFHLVSPGGLRLDPGYMPQDERLDGLASKLGIAKSLHDGLSLQEVIK